MCGLQQIVKILMECSETNLISIRNNTMIYNTWLIIQ